MCAITPLVRMNKALRVGDYNGAWHDLFTLNRLSRASIEIEFGPSLDRTVLRSNSNRLLVHSTWPHLNFLKICWRPSDQVSIRLLPK